MALKKTGAEYILWAWLFHKLRREYEQRGAHEPLATEFHTVAQLTAARDLCLMQLARMRHVFGVLLTAFADRDRKSHERFTFLFQVTFFFLISFLISRVVCLGVCACAGPVALVAPVG